MSQEKKIVSFSPILTLWHHPFCPRSRFVRLLLEEYRLPVKLRDEPFWLRRADFLKLNPSGEIPVLIEKADFPICGALSIAEYIDETRGYQQGHHRLLHEHPLLRAETRRLVNWALDKFASEVVVPLVHERIYKLEMPKQYGGGEPNSDNLRIARQNMRHHLRYFGYLAETRKCMGGDALGLADFAIAAALSCADYLGEVEWQREEMLKIWYARMKSRPAFKPIIRERINAIWPPKFYADLDF